MELIDNILSFDKELEKKYSNCIVVDDYLTRQLVSYQANKKQAFYNWFKYKEGFSADLVKYFFQKYKIQDGPILDPFAGIGTTLFVSSELGFKSDGIELLPSSIEIINARKTFLFELTEIDINIISKWKEEKPWLLSDGKIELYFFRITKGAYPDKTKSMIEKYLYELGKINDINAKKMLFLSLISILESVSFTRKDGQYLRWDFRSGRQVGTIPFDKGIISNFDEAINSKLNEIVHDFHLIKNGNLFKIDYADINIYSGSCLDIFPTLNSNYYQAIITSPPYCNRYDYTRTYALELGLLEISQAELNEIRQTMLSCTVENKEKNLMRINNEWSIPINISNNSSLLQSIIEYLENQKKSKLLNNNGIVRMVKGYFYELACIIYESYRVLKDGGLMFMVNDNVRYAGVSVSVDLILSDIAKEIGFKIDNILVLPIGKGNSSQQMGIHGREELRKCIYVWRK